MSPVEKKSLMSTYTTKNKICGTSDGWKLILPRKFQAQRVMLTEEESQLLLTDITSLSQKQQVMGTYLVPERTFAKIEKLSSIELVIAQIITEKLAKSFPNELGSVVAGYVGTEFYPASAHQPAVQLQKQQAVPSKNVRTSIQQ